MMIRGLDRDGSTPRRNWTLVDMRRTRNGGQVEKEDKGWTRHNVVNSMSNTEHVQKKHGSTG